MLTITVLFIFVGINTIMIGADTTICPSLSFSNNKTIVKFSNKEFLIDTTEGKMVIELSNKIKIDSIEKMNNPIILFCLDGRIKNAKGNFIFNSTIPNDCDFFYPTNKEQKIHFFNNEYKIYLMDSNQ